MTRRRARHVRPRTLFLPGAVAAGEDAVSSAEKPHLDATSTLVALASEVQQDPAAAAAVARELGPGAALELSAALRGYALRREAMMAIHPSAAVPRPSNKALFQLAMAACIPFVGFGFVDNAIMIMAGDVFDIYLGAAFGISTMAAAGLGNLCSDVGGVGLGGVIEHAAERMGFEPPRLSRAQQQLPIAKLCTHGGSAVGVALGCLLGMLPLLFMHFPENEHYKEKHAHDAAQGGKEGKGEEKSTAV